MPSSLIIHQPCTALVAPLPLLRRIAARIYAQEKISPKRVTNLILCSDWVIARLNRQWRQKEGPTDVLSFPFDDPQFLGEIYISLHRVRVQARRFKLSTSEELQRLLVHGLFHLQGYDHHTEKERIAMEAKERIYCPYLA
jgi:probable rRNA maturation factor